MSARVRANDWSRTPLGPIEGWSPALRTMTSILLANRFPMLLWWGPELISIYNDAYAPVLGTKHPAALGLPVRECWAEIYDALAPLILAPLNGGPPTWSEDLAFEIRRHGFLEETHWTVAYSPVPDETAPNGIGGVLATVHEITAQVVGRRRNSLLRDLGLSEAKTPEQACETAAAAFTRYPYDVPFALIYLLERDGRAARLAAAAGIEPGGPESRSVVDLLDDRDANGWRIAEAVRTQTTQFLEDLGSRFAKVPSGPWPTPPQRALVMPIASNLAHHVAGVLVVGLSPLLELDASYRGFIDLATARLATTIASARAYEEERRRAESLAELDRAKTVFFSNVSHEFRTPLTLMLGPVEEGLQDASDPLSPGQRERQETIYRNALRLLKLVNTLLDFSRIEVGRAHARYEPTDISALTSEVASSFRSLVERAGLKLVIECPPVAEPVFVDPSMWEKIVLNLISNAFKFTFEGEIVVRVEAEPQLVRLIVRDTGTGIDEDHLPHLFERFYRVEGARGRTYEGTGIGLALVRELAKLHAGAVSVASERGKGTTFTVTLPTGSAHLEPGLIHTPSARASSAVAAQSFVEEGASWLGEMSHEPADRAFAEPARHDGPARPVLLVADDNADMRAYLERLLRPLGTVEVVKDGQEALAAIARRIPDLVVSDVMMPNLDGVGLLRAVRADPRTTTLPVVLLSARAGEESRIEGASVGADDYIVKPFSARELVARVRSQLQLAGQRREHAEALRVTERARAEEATRLSAFATFFSRSPVAMSILRVEDGQHLDVNGSWLEVFDRRREDIIGRTARELSLWSRPEQADELHARLASEHAIKDVELRMTRRSGEKRIALVSAQLIDVAGDRIVLSSFQDITDRKRAEQALVEADHRKNEFLGVLSHELRNPLAPISNSLFVLDHVEPGSEQAERAKQIIGRQVTHLTNLVNDLLDVTRIARSKIQLQKGRLELNELLRRAVEDNLSLFERAGIRLALDPAPRPVPLHADGTRVAQVVSNLLQNSAKFTNKGGHTRVSVAVESGEAVVRVIDDGVGMTRETLDHLYQPFAQAEQSLDRSQGGLGLGLALVKGLVELHGGTVSAHSEGLGRGTEMTVRLPVDAEIGVEAAATRTHVASARRRVLIIEDNVDAADSLSVVLGLGNNDVAVAYNGPDGIAKARQYHPDVVLCDIGLPGMDGYHVARVFRADDLLLGTFLVALSGYARPEDLQRATDAGFDRHLAKPVTVEKLAQLLAAVPRDHAGSAASS